LSPLFPTQLMSRNPNRISSYLPRSLSINSLYNQKDFSRKNYSQVMKIKIRTLFKLTNDPSISSKLLKLTTRSCKNLRQLTFHDHLTLQTKFNKPKMIYLMKKMKRINHLKLQNYCDPRLPFQISLHLWMKHTRLLNKINYYFQPKSFQARAFPQSKSVQQSMESFIRNLRFQPKMTSLKLLIPEKTHFANKTLLQFAKYPSSLKHLEFHHETYSQPGRLHIENFSLSSLQKIESFSLQFTRHLQNRSSSL